MSGNRSLWSRLVRRAVVSGAKNGDSPLCPRGAEGRWDRKSWTERKMGTVRSVHAAQKRGGAFAELGGRLGTEWAVPIFRSCQGFISARHVCWGRYDWEFRELLLGNVEFDFFEQERGGDNCGGG